MDGADFDPRSATSLVDAFQAAAGGGLLTQAARDFAVQVAQDLRADELAGVTHQDLAELLAGFWKFAETRTPGAAIRLQPAYGADARDLKFDLLQIVQDDAPFLVDSVMAELAESGFTIAAMVHPVVWVARDGVGRRTDEGQTREESMILVVLAPVGEDRRAALLEGVAATLADVRAAVDDFPAMAELMRRTARELAVSHAPSEPYGMAEYQAFLSWLNADRFVFLGARTYAYPRTPDGGYAAEEPVFRAEDSLGVLRDGRRTVLRRQNEPAVLASELSAYLEHAAPLVVAKSNLRSRVHRRTYTDYIGIKRYGPDGRAFGEVRFVGLFTSEAYETPAHDTPLVRRKLDHVFERAVENPSAHTKNRLRRIVETYPRDELFQIGEADLLAVAMGILHLYDRPRVRLFARTDPFDRFVSVLLYVPRDRYDSGVRERAGAMLARAFGGRVSAFYPNFSEDALVRVHFIIGVSPGGHLQPDLARLEAELAEAVRTWSDRFEALVRGGGVARTLVPDILHRWGQAFPVGYRDLYPAQEAVTDLSTVEGMGPESIRVRAYRHPDDTPTHFRFKLYRRGPDPVPLAEVLPLLGDMGLKALYEDGFALETREADGPGPVTWVHDFVLEDERGENLVFADVRAAFEDAFVAIWTGCTESDGFNRLVLELGVTWREAALIRTLARYRQQTGLDPSQAVQEAALADHPQVARLILDLFRIQFDPALAASVENRGEQAAAVFAELVEALQAVESLDADRVLRRMGLLVRALKRTNFYQVAEDGGPKSCISVKIASCELADVPAPKPYREIFVWSPQVEGVHLRFGPVARGGLRWSDRRDDFRTEVLGLVKAQQVKNAVIVPVGSKGGFYPKSLPRTVKGQAPAADAVREEGVRAYRTFLSGLLDITDNLSATGEVERPRGVIAHEGDDPYLVVAADKGTATFSDIANGVAADYGFWLGDAFASGGSAGYDHKVMGITARGAWEAVKRHFREMGRDIQGEPFTCVGVGDMSGDVFGNGALLSRQMKLSAAFDHRHVFLDPDPDPARSWEERSRLFALPRSSWADYDAGLISKGGGVFARTAKSIDLTPEVSAMLGVADERLSPAELIRAILKADADLLYLGGIGTYVKAAGESDAQVGDKANDAVRVDAGDLRAKVVGEGANLGFTQAARIAYARSGGRINTDAIDNSAGVDTSDHEVNIKILTGQAERDGVLKSQDRDGLLASMTGEIAAHVLAHNTAQTLALSLQEANAPAELDAQEQFMEELEEAGRLDRRVEGLPTTTALADLRAAGRGLTRPELAVVTAYGKLELSAEIVAGRAIDDAYFERVLVAYFPPQLTAFEAQMKRHRLRREIIATVVANDMVDLAGPTFASRAKAAAGTGVDALVTAFEAARQVFRLDDAWRETAGLDLQMGAEGQLALFREVSGVLRGQTFWLAQRTGAAEGGVAGLIEAYRPTADVLLAQEADVLSEFERAAADTRAQAFIEAGAPETLARRVAALRPLTATADIADLTRESGWEPLAVARLYFQVGARLGLDRLRAAAADIRGADPYERSALRGLIVEMIAEQVAAARDALGAGAPIDDVDAALVAWSEARKPPLDRARRVIGDIEQAGGGWSFAKLTLANAALRAAA